MSIRTETPRGTGWRPGTAGRRNKAHRSLARHRFYQQGGAPASEQLFAQTAKGWLPVGRVEQRDGGKVLVKQVDSERHRLRKPPGYALECSTFDEARAAGVTVVEIHERDTGQTLTATIDAFERHGLRLTRGGFAPQIALPLSRWQVRDPKAPTLFDFEEALP